MFRAQLVVLLVVVEYLPPSPAYRWLRHSPWDGVRVADVVFPGFLFVVGASAAVARRQLAYALFAALLWSGLATALDRLGWRLRV